MLDLVIDGNAFINVAISVTKNIAFRDREHGPHYVENLTEGGYSLKESIRISFRDFFFRYLNSTISSIGTTPAHVHFVMDSKSWRRKAFREFFDGTQTSNKDPIEYKGHRVTDDMKHVFFDYVEKAIFPLLIKEHVINYVKVSGTEGDDLIAYLCGLGNDTIVFSVDQDLIQLVRNDTHNVALILPKQNHKAKRLFYKEPIAVDTTDDIFDGPSVSEFKRAIDHLKSYDYEVQAFDTTHEVLSKILSGDKSDNIPRLPKLTPMKAGAVMKDILEFENVLRKLEDRDLDLIGAIARRVSLETKAAPEDYDKILNHINANITLILLSTRVLPSGILESIETYFKNNPPTRFSSRGLAEVKNNKFRI